MTHANAATSRRRATTPTPSATVRVRPVDRLFAAYLAVSGVALVFPHGNALARATFATLHLLGIGLVLRWRPLRTSLDRALRRWPRLARATRDWYPLALIPFAYAELPVLNHAIWNGHYFDGVVRTLQALVLGPQPFHELALHVPYLVFSELLNVGYLSYYLIVFVPPIALYAMGRRAAFRGMVFGVFLAFSAHYVWYVYFPVLGPFFVTPGAQAYVAGGPAERLAHAVLNGGASMGATFPSSHMGVSVAQVVYVRRYLPALLWPVVLATLGVGVGAVYGGYHYAIDVVTGAAYGFALAMAMPALRRRLG